MAKKAEIKEGIGKRVPLNWVVPEGLTAVYATNIVAQRGENEVTLNFFQQNRPIIIGSPAEIKERWKEVKSVDARCVARVVIAADAVPGFIEAVQKVIEQEELSTESE